MRLFGGKSKKHYSRVNKKSTKVRKSRKSKTLRKKSRKIKKSKKLKGGR